MENALKQSEHTHQERENVKTRRASAGLLLGTSVKACVTPKVRGYGRQLLALLTKDVGGCRDMGHPDALEW